VEIFEKCEDEYQPNSNGCIAGQAGKLAKGLLLSLWSYVLPAGGQIHRLLPYLRQPRVYDQTAERAGWFQGAATFKGGDVK
jgi:hypothetical protein